MSISYKSPAAMKCYVNSQSRLLGNDEKSYWMTEELFPPYMDKNLMSRYDTCFETFSKNLHTISYDDTTKVGDEINLDGTNFTGNADENPSYEKFVTILKEMIEWEDEHNG